MYVSVCVAWVGWDARYALQDLAVLDLAGTRCSLKKGMGRLGWT